MNYDSRPPASMAQNSPGSRAGNGCEEGTAGEEAKNAIAVTSLPEPEKEEREKEAEVVRDDVPRSLIWSNKLRLCLRDPLSVVSHFTKE
ncbi:zinc finger and BTB domain-containing protein 44-like isoform X1 [Clarias magur]|uniref:Zinc finger and BTB domain-containing protein 44-like isoform X1 n=1 Tax=Clarias magur TaxID=1594786 RepID=A0A8J4XBU6_CLAMG|nr:zinc finger and BTB domain-containing protein 44-like isoform X1 [Clarias magur]